MLLVIEPLFNVLFMPIKNLLCFSVPAHSYTLRECFQSILHLLKLLRWNLTNELYNDDILPQDQLYF